MFHTSFFFFFLDIMLKYYYHCSNTQSRVFTFYFMKKANRWSCYFVLTEILGISQEVARKYRVEKCLSILPLNGSCKMPKSKKKKQFKNVNFFNSSPIYQTTNFTFGEGNGYPLQYSCQDNPMDRGACWTTLHGNHKESDTTEQQLHCVARL